MRPGRGWRALGAFWATVLVLLAGGTGVLAVLGPPPAPPRPPAAAAPPTAEAAAPPTAEAAAPRTAEAAAPRTAEAAAPRTAEAAAPRTAEGAAPRLAEAPAPPDPPAPQDAAARPAGPPARTTPAADPALLDPGPHGPLPRIGPDGRTPIRVYGRPFDRQEQRPRVGLILGGLGMNAALTEEAIRRLPGGIGLAFSPYAPRLPPLLDEARARGMELLVAIPLEPTGYPLNSPGDRALLTSLPGPENEDRLFWAMSRFTGYVGAIGALGPLRGERFAALSERLGGVQDVLRSRGLLYVDPRPGARGPARAWGRVVDLVVDEPATRGEIEIKLAALERLALERGSALGYAGEPTPVLIDRAAAWAGSLEGRGLALAPVTALMRRPEPPDAPAAARVR